MRRKARQLAFPYTRTRSPRLRWWRDSISALAREWITVALVLFIVWALLYGPAVFWGAS